MFRVEQDSAAIYYGFYGYLSWILWLSGTNIGLRGAGASKKPRQGEKYEIERNMKLTEI